MTSQDKPNGFKGIVKEVLDQILPGGEVDINEIREEVWRDLSALYYKYEDEAQKKAFREVMSEIAEKIGEGRWDSVYKKLYREDQKNRQV
ncbi:hypothetical protein DRN98_10395 [Methanosarcinales archaeon]|nr:MAG: hypothetical protein DRN98_10395 [Methanosarcinales archaeon]